MHPYGIDTDLDSLGYWDHPPNGLKTCVGCTIDVFDLDSIYFFEFTDEFLCLRMSSSDRNRTLESVTHVSWNDGIVLSGYQIPYV